MASGGKSRVTSIVLVSQIGMPSTVKTCGSSPSDCAFGVFGKDALGFRDRFVVPSALKYWTYTHTQRT